MSYSIEQSRNINLEDTEIPNLFIGEFMPDAEGDFVKVYIYAYMCCKQNIQMTHVDVADKLCISLEKVVAAWKYFESRRIVRLIKMDDTSEINFDVEFVDIKGMLYTKDKAPSSRAASKAAEKFDNAKIKTMFSNIATICEAPTFDGDDVQKVYKWISQHNATPEIIEAAYQHARDTKGNTNTDYVAKIVKTWASKELKTKNDVDEYLAETDSRYQIYKELMAALGIRYQSITEAEKKIFNTWLDEYGYTPSQLLEMAEKTAGVTGNRLSYMGGIIRNDRAKKGEPVSSDSAKGRGLAGRKEKYKKIREENEATAEAHRKEVYGAAPAIKALDDEISYLNMELMKVLTSKSQNKKATVEGINKKVKARFSEREKLMDKAGFPKGYTEVKYNCDKCKDTGILENGASCDCLDVKQD